MGLFNTNKRSKVPAFLLDDDERETTNDNEISYNSVLDYLVGLSDDDHDKIFKVSAIYRKANKQASEVLGVEDQAINTIADQATTSPASDDDVSDDELDAMLNGDTPFIEDEPKSKRAK
jgi:hypothetical protein